MTIIARYASRCATCGQSIAAGEQIEWSKGRPVRHATCPVAGIGAAPTTPTSPPASSARRPFRCRRCGDTRDTTIPGHCDDCE